MCRDTRLRLPLKFKYTRLVKKARRTPVFVRQPLHRVSLRRRISRWFDDDALHSNKAAHFFNLFLAVLIVVNVATVILEDRRGSIRDRYGLVFSIARACGHGDLFQSNMCCGCGRSSVFTILDSSTRCGAGCATCEVSSPVVDLVSVLPALLGFLGAETFRCSVCFGCCECWKPDPPLGRLQPAVGGIPGRGALDRRAHFSSCALR